MRHRYTFILPLLSLFSLLLSMPAHAQTSYSNFDSLTEKLHSLAFKYEDKTTVQSLAKSPGGHDVWLLTIGTGDTSTKPALAVVGGVKGSHILGSELALKFAEQLLARSKTDSIRNVLEGTTFYVMPRVNPDAAAQYFADIKYERNGNATETDDDRDGVLNEDGPEDLNGDGLITMMRIANRTGDYMVNANDSRGMAKADPNRDKAQHYRLLKEGRDDDRDKTFNEDGDGGVNINKNFTFDYPYFQPGAGENMASQPETRAVMDFLFDQGWNVYGVVSFGPENNLSEPLSYEAGAATKRIVASWLEEDISINKRVSDLYNATISLGNAPEGPPQQGDFFQWAYYHYGRLSFSTPGWWVPSVKDDSGKIKKFKNDMTHYLAWADSQNVESFVEWQQVDHPDFPNQTVEVGGIKPFYQTTPPYSAVDSLARQHTDFLIKLAQMRPKIELVNFKSETVSDGLTRITVDVYNAGELPTATQIGERTRWVRDVNVQLNLSDNLSIVSGLPFQSFASIKANESKTLSWLIRGEGSYSITAGAPTAGFKIIEKSTH